MPATARRNCQSGAPKRRPSRSAIGRAPIATTSRMMPPTPVAAPWNGSTALGWLCDSTLKATAAPSPRSITPAFSPGPCSTRSPSDGRWRSSRAECLYPQCSDQRTENTASSKSFGSRPCSSLIRPNSQSVRPRARWRGCGATAFRGPVYRAGPDVLLLRDDEGARPDARAEVVLRPLAEAGPDIPRVAAGPERVGVAAERPVERDAEARAVRPLRQDLHARVPELDVVVGRLCDWAPVQQDATVDAGLLAR